MEGKAVTIFFPLSWPHSRIQSWYCAWPRLGIFFFLGHGDNRRVAFWQTLGKGEK